MEAKKEKMFNTQKKLNKTLLKFKIENKPFYVVTNLR